MVQSRAYRYLHGDMPLMTERDLHARIKKKNMAYNLNDNYS